MAPTGAGSTLPLGSPACRSAARHPRRLALSCPRRRLRHPGAQNTHPAARAGAHRRWSQSCPAHMTSKRVEAHGCPTTHASRHRGTPSRPATRDPARALADRPLRRRQPVTVRSGPRLVRLEGAREWRNGRRSRLRICRLRAWGFKSPLPHPLGNPGKHLAAGLSVLSRPDRTDGSRRQSVSELCPRTQPDREASARQPRIAADPTSRPSRTVITAGGVPEGGGDPPTREHVLAVHTLRVDRQQHLHRVPRPLGDLGSRKPGVQPAGQAGMA